MSGSFCVYVAGMSLKIHGDIMCPPACLRVGRAPNHCHAVALHPGMCVCVGAVCTRVLGQAHLALHSGASRSWALPAGLPGRSSSPCSHDRRPVLVTSCHSELRSVYHPSEFHKPRSPPAKATFPIPQQALLCLRFPKLYHDLTGKKSS